MFSCWIDLHHPKVQKWKGRYLWRCSSVRRQRKTERLSLKKKNERHIWKRFCKTFVKDLKYWHLIKIWKLFSLLFGGTRKPEKHNQRILIIRRNHKVNTNPIFDLCFITQSWSWSYTVKCPLILVNLHFRF